MFNFHNTVSSTGLNMKNGLTHHPRVDPGMIFQAPQSKLHDGGWAHVNPLNERRPRFRQLILSKWAYLTLT